MRKKKIVPTIISAYLFLWAATATVGISQCNSLVDNRLKEVTAFHKLNDPERYVDADELFDKTNRETFGYYSNAYSPTPFWIKMEVQAQLSMESRLNLLWFFGYIGGFPENRHIQSERDNG
ncbi:MAG: hypothetical protein AAF065_15010 [Verrucomicrobiota bacterium]